jgi:RNA polymerase II subunit A small phosphatase-like protein
LCASTGLEEYAAPIIDAIDPTRELIAARIYRDGTTKTEHYQCVKDMRLVGRDLNRTVLVDDTPLAFLHQPTNGIPVLGFRGDPDDRLLHEAVLPLLQVGGFASRCGLTHAVQSLMVVTREVTGREYMYRTEYACSAKNGENILVYAFATVTG